MDEILNDCHCSQHWESKTVASLMCFQMENAPHLLEATIFAMSLGHQKYIPSISKVYKKYVRNDIAIRNLEFCSERWSGFGSSGKESASVEM